MPVHYTRVSAQDELQQILDLQQQNLKVALDQQAIIEEGFVTVGHTYDVLEKMNAACPHIIAKDGDLVVGYALAMRKEFRNEIPVLAAMFETAKELLGDKNYLAMGQVCVAKEYRKQGVFRGMYLFYKAALEGAYDCLLTEVATENKRSLEAHKSVGFEIIKTQVTGNISWELMNWNWR